jgi:predicted ATP-dependent endonuclease of OLD family
MKLIRAKIENFRSIEDSGIFTLDEHTTCFVGKNESGKTALLNALYRLNPIFNDVNFDKEKDYPRRSFADYEEKHEGKDPSVITTWWAIESSEKKAIIEKFGAKSLQSDEVEIQKGYGDSTYWTIKTNEAEIVNHLIDISDLNDEEKLQVASIKNIAALKAKISAVPEPSSAYSQLIQTIDHDFPKASCWRGIHKLLDFPKFLLFSQYQRMQGQVSLEQIQQKMVNNSLEDDDQVFVALCEMASATIDQVSSIQNFDTLVSKFEAASNKISKEVFTYWSQNRFLRVNFRLDSALPGDPAPFNSGRIFRTRIFNQLHEVSVPFDDRSTGFVWFFSFIALFSQVKKRHRGGMILLLDEPGLSLHGKAQADLLRYFKERLAPNYQVIYTTHSPFMVPSDNLLSARTVEDVIIHRQDEPPEVLGTKIGSDVLSTDRDTLFPLQAALGYEITQSLFVGPHTLLVEGPGDILYLKAMSEALRLRQRTFLDRRWTICPAGSIDKVRAFMSLFSGNHLHVAVLTDFATGQKKKIEDFRRSKLLLEGHVLTMDTYAAQPEADVEDVIGSTLYIQTVNECYALTGKQALTIPTSGSRIVKYTEDEFRTMPSSVPEFDHYTPAVYFIEHQSKLLSRLSESELNLVIERFESLFGDLNALLPT